MNNDSKNLLSYIENKIAESINNLNYNYNTDSGKDLSLYFKGCTHTLIEIKTAIEEDVLSLGQENPIQQETPHNSRPSI